MELNLQKGDVVICALSGDYGKPRPGIIVQSDLFNATHSSITICPVTSHLVAAPLFRLDLEPTAQNGLKKSSQIMVDKITSLQRDKVQQKIGAVTIEQFSALNHALKIWLNLAE